MTKKKKKNNKKIIIILITMTILISIIISCIIFSNYNRLTLKGNKIINIDVITIIKIGAVLKNIHSNECHNVPITDHSGLL